MPVFSTGLAQFSTGVALVEVYATVADRSGRPLPGLSRDDFIVEEDGIRQAVAAFAAGEFPLAVAVGIDRSFSMSRERLRQSTTAVRHFLETLSPEDRTMVIAFGSETEVLAPLSTDRGRALAALSGIDPWGTTPLYDAALTAIDAVQTEPGRRALILLSDGQDRGSHASADELVSTARRTGVLIYPIALGVGRPAVFAELAGVTGGRSLGARDVKQLQEALANIASELRTQYLLGYVASKPAAAGESWRSIHVSVKRPDATVRARDGYVPK